MNKVVWCEAVRMEVEKAVRTRLCGGGDCGGGGGGDGR